MNDFENFIKKQKSKKENGKKSRHLKGVENFKADPSKDVCFKFIFFFKF